MHVLFATPEFNERLISRPQQSCMTFCWGNLKQVQVSGETLNSWSSGVADDAPLVWKQSVSGTDWSAFKKAQAGLIFSFLALKSRQCLDDPSSFASFCVFSLLFDAGWNAEAAVLLHQPSAWYQISFSLSLIAFNLRHVRVRNVIWSSSPRGMEMLCYVSGTYGSLLTFSIMEKTHAWHCYGALAADKHCVC